MTRIGIAGIGFMGMVHYLTYQRLRGARVAALCEQDQKRLAGDWRGIQGNFGPAGKEMDLTGIARYDDLNAMLADESLDAIDITLPPGLHAQIAIKALRAGKHVFCEKPMALRPRDCDRMAAAAAKAGRLLMVGHVLPFYPEYAWAYKTVQSGKYGRMLGGAFRRVISDPQWLPHYWSAQRVGGPMLDLHVHDAHFIRLLFGMPDQVVSVGRMRDDLAQFWHTQFHFANQDYVVEATSGTIDQQGRPFEHGFEIHLERATLMFDFAVLGSTGRMLCQPTLLDDKGRVKHPKLSAGDPMDAFRAELREILRAIRTGEPSPILDGALARDAIVICQKQTESLRKGRPVKIGAKKQ